MNENLNLVTILKDCPKGTKLYSTIHGEIEFSRIDMIKMDKHPIVAVAFIRGMLMDVYFTVEGKYLYGYDGECILFPSKDQRDWSKFKVEPEMVNGEFYYCNYKGRKYIFIYKEKGDMYKTNNYAIIKVNDLPFILKQNAPIYCGYLAYFDELRNATEDEKQLLLNVIKREGYKWDEENKKLVKIETDMVDGEIYCTKIDNYGEWIYIYKKNDTFETNHYIALLNGYFIEYNGVLTTHNENIKELRKATEEEKQYLLRALKRDGYEWDEKKKELVKIEPKFDIANFQPFDKVLVRDNNTQIWKCNFYDSYVKGIETPFLTIRGFYKQCVSYNDETKYLIGTKKMPPKKYITWEE